MTQIYLKPLANTTQSVSQMLSRLGLDLKPGLIFHGHPGQIRFLGSYDLGLHPKADQKLTFGYEWTSTVFPGYSP